MFTALASSSQPSLRVLLATCCTIVIKLHHLSRYVLHPSPRFNHTQRIDAVHQTD